MPIVPIRTYWLGTISKFQVGLQVYLVSNFLASQFWDLHLAQAAFLAPSMVSMQVQERQ